MSPGGVGVPDYSPPYHHVLGGPDPSIEEMRQAVCVERARPELPNHWTSQPVLAALAKLMAECWYETAASRLTALRVKKTLAAVANGGLDLTNN